MKGDGTYKCSKGERTIYRKGKAIPFFEMHDYVYFEGEQYKVSRSMVSSDQVVLVNTMSNNRIPLNDTVYGLLHFGEGNQKSTDRFNYFD